MTDTADAGARNPTPELRPELRPGLRNWCEAWRKCSQDVLSQVSGKTSTSFEISSEPLPATDSDVWYIVAAGGAVRGEMTLRLAAAAGTRLARMLLGEPQPAPAATGAETANAETVAPQNIAPENKEALEELLRQIVGLAATVLGAAAGGEVQLSLTASAAPSWSSDAVVCLRTKSEGEAAAAIPIAIEIRISPALAAALVPRVEAAQTSLQTASPSSSSEPPSAGYGRLMDVGLDVKLRFGTRRMVLRDVIALSAGVVVELDNTLHSSVDLLLDGRLIAQGEVVVVDGKYGLRITDIVDPAPAAGPAARS